ncbi:MAG TPA: DUF4416 family protein [Spirochaetota bacterium]|nr:DUF4416 family protein [Spirochaetota bacterium]
MSQPQKPTRGIVTFSCLAARRHLFEKILPQLTAYYGQPAAPPVFYNFTHSSYYEKEMGTNLVKMICGFQKLCARKNIYKAKWKAFKLEKKHSHNSRRLLNLDPGFLSAENFILLTFKNFSHRIYMRKNVFAELTLQYSAAIKNFTDLPWTYPDYKQEKVKKYLLKLRHFLLGK